MSRVLSCISSLLLAVHILITPVFDLSVPQIFAVTVKQGDPCKGSLGGGNTYTSKWRISGGRAFCIKTDNPAPKNPPQNFNNCWVGFVGTGAQRCRMGNISSGLPDKCYRKSVNIKITCPPGAG